MCGDTASALFALMQCEKPAHSAYNLSSGFSTSPREQLLALYRLRPDAADILGLDPADLRAEPFASASFNADLLSRDTGWKSGFSFEEAIADYLEWLSVHTY